MSPRLKAALALLAPLITAVPGGALLGAAIGVPLAGKGGHGMASLAGIVVGGPLGALMLSGLVLLLGWHRPVSYRLKSVGIGVVAGVLGGIGIALLMASNRW